MRPAGRALLLVVGLTAAVAPRAAALPPGSGRAAEAFALCQLADQSPPAVRADLLARGLALAEAAADADATDALAHFAVFCNLARRAQTAGVSIGRAFDVLRLVPELDATLALAPDDADVLAAKGAVLATLPRFLGGDPARSVQCLRRALELDPRHGVARSYLAEVRASR